LGLSALSASAATLPPPAAGINPFPVGNAQVFIAQGEPPGSSTTTQLYTAQQIGGTQVQFTSAGTPPVSILYNALGFHLSDMYLYAFQVSTNTLLRIGQGGAVQSLGPVSGLPSDTSLASNGGLNAGAFGDSSCLYTDATTTPATPCTDILFVREGSNSTNTQTLWAVNIDTMSATSIHLSQVVPNTADLTFSQGYLWSVYGNGTSTTTVTVYRIDPVTGTVTTFTMPGTTAQTLSTTAIYDQSYGAQWTYGNGDIGIAGNTAFVPCTSGAAATCSAVYQIQITNPGSTQPTFTIVAAMPAPASSQNDGAAYGGTPVDLSIDKQGTLAYDAVGGDDIVTYILTVTNNSAAGVYSSGSVVTDTLPPELKSAEAEPDKNATCLIDDSKVLTCNVGVLNGGDSSVITVIGTILSSTPDTVTNTAAVMGNEIDPNPDNNMSTVTVSTVAPTVKIAKTSSATGALAPDGSVTYTVTVTNTGTINASGTVVSDPLTTGIASATWICGATGGAVCPDPSGSGALNETLNTFPGGSSVIYAITATDADSLPPVVTNVATAQPPSGGQCADGSTPPCSANASNPAAPIVSILKTASTTAALAPGGTITYTVIVANAGVAAAPKTVVSDPLPTGIAGATWTCVAAGGAVCPTASGSGALNETLDTFPAGSNVTYTIAATVAASGLPAAVTNQASATPPGGLCANGSAPPCNSAPISNPTVPMVSIAKKSSTTAALDPDGSVTYTITVTNTGASDASGTVVSDPLPAGIASAAWSCVPTSGAACPNAGGNITSGGALNETLTTFPAGSSVVYTIESTDAGSLPAVVLNTATATPPGGGLCANGSAAPCLASVSNPAAPIIDITEKASTTAALDPGGTITYMVTVTNTGTVDASGTVVNNPLPQGIDAAAWTCVATGGAECPSASGTGPITNQTLATFPAGSSVIYTIQARAGSSGLPAKVTDTATAMPPSGGLCAHSSTLPCIAGVSNPVASGTGTVTPIPALDARALALLALLVGCLAWFTRRKARR
jgi:uncharacterized repeat protein (TIGR01451 family)